MTRLVPVLAGSTFAQTLAVGVEQGAIYVITGPDGTRAVFNNRDDRDHVGFLTAPPTGLDSADVRESADLIVEGDGGIHGDFYFGRRPITLTGIVDPVPDPAVDVDGLGAIRSPGAVASRRINQLQRATRALRGDAILSWTPILAPQVQIRCRRQQPLKISDRMPKHFLIALVAADPLIYGSIVKSVTNAATAVCRNEGNVGTPPSITLRGAWNNPVITNQLTGQALVLSSLGLMAGGDVLVIDFKAKTVLLNGTNRYGSLNFTSSTFFDLLPGDNPIAVTGGAGTSIQVDYSDAWD